MPGWCDGCDSAVPGLTPVGLCTRCCAEIREANRRRTARFVRREASRVFRADVVRAARIATAALAVLAVVGVLVVTGVLR